jgi:predicted AlkP superfamily phosphohydrolase/phosphomutase
MIGWDAADRAAVAGWMRDGALPNLHALRERGHWREVAGLPGLSDDACWASFATGVEPGVHGRFHHRQIVPGTYRLENFFRDRMTSEPFWSALGRTGRRVAVLDVPKAPLAAEPLNGLELANWMPHGEDGPDLVSTPVAVAASLPARFRPPPSISCHELRTTVAGFEELVARIHGDLERRTALALEWLAQERWDLFVTIFAESHCVGHHCWHLHADSHSAHDRALRRALGDPVLAAHRSLDQALGRLLAACDDDTVVMVFSLAGMGRHHFGSGELVDAVLRRLEERGGLRSSLRRVAERLRPSREPSWDEIDAEGRSAFAVHSQAVATPIRLNVAGREPRGVVAPKAYGAQCRFLAESFAALVDPTTGRRLVTEVVPVATRYPGPRASAYADLLVVWDGAAPITAAASAAIGTVATPPAVEPAGNHGIGGWCVTAGKGLTAEAATPMAITDFARAALALLA